MTLAIPRFRMADPTAAPMRRTGHRTLHPVALLIAFVVGTAPALGQTSRLPKPQIVGTVTSNEALFWDGEIFVERALGPAALLFVEGQFIGSEPVDCMPPPPEFLPPEFPPQELPEGTMPCWAYQFDVSDTADTLRIAMDLNSREDCFLGEIYEPGTYDRPGSVPTSIGLTHCPELGEIVQTWNKEVFIQQPAVGVWTIRIVPHRIENLGFRFRAALQKHAKDGHGDAELRPNLVAYPPYEFGFTAPANPLAGIAFDHLNPAGPTDISCTADELVEAAEDGRSPSRCLRFSFGLYNAGPGLFDLALHEDTPGGGTATQRIHAKNGTVREKAAGEWEFHAAHGHAHYTGSRDDPGFVVFRLYRVDLATGTLEFVPSSKLNATTSGAKTGMNPGDQRFLRWERIDQGENFTCGDLGTCLSLTNGWGDHYRWQRPGNYVEFPAAGGTGDYVLQVTVDRDNLLAETKDDDNVAYAWIRVNGDQVSTCERGVGSSPWDRQKRVHRPSYWLDTPGGTTADSSDNCSRLVD